MGYGSNEFNVQSPTATGIAPVASSSSSPVASAAV
jgi:hypothetical protein